MVRSPEHGLKLVKLPGRPIAALPRGQGQALARQELVLQYPAVTWRRALVQRRLRVASRFPSIGRPPRASEMGFDPDSLHQQVQRLLGQQADCLGVVWPANPHRGRRYIYVFDDRGAVLAFAKAGLGSADREALEREARTLEELNGWWGKDVRVPRLLGRLVVRGASVLLQEPLPRSCLPTTQEQRLAIAGQRSPSHAVAPMRLLETRWWAGYTRVRSVQDFHERLVNQLDRADVVAVGPAHGDLSPANALSCGAVVWLMDFEDSSAEAPAFTDLVGAFVSAAPRQVLANPQRAIAGLLAEVVLAGGNELDAMLAVAYRIASGMGDAIVLARRWPAQ